MNEPRNLLAVLLVLFPLAVLFPGFASALRLRRSGPGLTPEQAKVLEAARIAARFYSENGATVTPRRIRQPDERPERR